MFRRDSIMNIQSTLSTWVNELLLVNTLDITGNSFRAGEVFYLQEKQRSLLFLIDAAVEDYPSLMAGTIPGVEAILLEPDRDGIEQITEILANCPDVTTVHLVSHGTPGCLYLGNSQLSLNTLANY
jgi:hypothetical protein